MNLLKDILNTLFDRTSELFRNSKQNNKSIETLCYELLSSKGQLSAMTLSQNILSIYHSLSDNEKISFFLMLIKKMGFNLSLIEKTIDEFKTLPNTQKYNEITKAIISDRQKLFNRLNQTSFATSQLVKMREDIIRLSKNNKEILQLSLDLQNLFVTWFNRGFLVLRAITWNSPANILEKIIKYEAVHSFNNWEDLQRRLIPSDRECFAFFHPAMPDEPLIFVQVALTTDIPNSIQEILRDGRKIIDIEKASTATFYSISNCQKGLQGISFGNSLIKTVVQEISKNNPQIKNFVTLSPLPNFTKWLKKIKIKKEHFNLKKNNSGFEYLKRYPKKSLEFASYYLTNLVDNDLEYFDPVAKFHLTNGAIVYDIHEKADVSQKGKKQSLSIMVNYLYDTKNLTQNHENFVLNNKIISSEKITKGSKRISELILK